MTERVMARRADAPVAEDQRSGQRTEPMRDWPERERINPLEDKMTLPPSVMGRIPPGFSYEWKRYSTLGQPDHQHYNRMLRAAWRPVPAKRHPELSSDPGSPAETIMQDGSMLMERPAAYNEQARREERDRAALQYATQLGRIGHTPDGHAPRVTEGRDPKLGVRQDYSIPVDPETMGA